MKEEEHHRACEIFSAAVRADPAARTALLESACGGNQALRRNVESLLRYHEQPAGLLDAPSAWHEMAGELAAALAHSSNGVLPERIGRYRVLRRLGEGGMGVVYLAEQDKPRRLVALKVIRPIFASPHLLRRFEFEEEALGRLGHPGIAQIIEASVDDGGQPFFAMEYIDGRPLAEHAREHDLSITQRLDLMALVCDAVQHAHQRGVIHRDLKPRNMLVTEEGRPKILDFGVARAIRPDKQAESLQTDAGQLIGTLAYMSPEQIAADPALDARSDVYSLGVILYELLVNHRPYDLNGRPPHQAAQVILETEPARLSGINQSLRGDVETIVVKAMEKEIALRYQSAAELAADLRRYLAGEPIAARQASALYLLRKKLHRYRWAALAACGFVILLAAFAFYSAWQAGVQSRLADREIAARERAQRAQQDAVAARQQEFDQRTAAEAQTARAQAVTAFLVDTLGFTDPDIAQDPHMTVDDLLEQASSQIGRAFGDQPEAEAVVRAVIGRAYAGQGELEAAELHLRRALEIRRTITPENHQARYEILWPYWRVLADLDDPESRSPRAEALRTGRAIIAQTHPELAEALQAFARTIKLPFDQSQADPAFDHAARLAAQTLAPDDPLWMYVADQFHMQGYTISSVDPAAAGRYLQAALDILRPRVGETNTRIARTLDLLIACKIKTQQNEKAQRLIAESLALLVRVLPADHWYIAVHKARLGESLAHEGEYEQAEALLLENYPRIVAGRGESNTHAIATLKAIINLYEAWGRLEAAQPYRATLAQSLAARVLYFNMDDASVVIGPKHQALIDAMLHARSMANDPQSDIGPACERVSALLDESFAEDDPVCACVAEVLFAWVQRHRRAGGPIAQTQATFERVLEIDQAGLWRHPRKRVGPLWHLCLNALEERQPVEAERYGREAIAVLESGPPEHYGYTACLRSNLGHCLMEQNRLDEAEQELLGAYQQLQTLSPGNGNAIIAASRLAELYQRWNRPQESETFALIVLEHATSQDRLDGASINRAAWAIVRAPGYSISAYQQAAAAAQRAVDSQPDHPHWLNTLGVAQYRIGQYAAALQTLMRTDEMHGRNSPDDVAPLAMTLWRLGRVDDARTQLARLRHLLDHPQRPFKHEYGQFLQEAQSMIK